MSYAECKYIIRNVFDKHVFMPGYGNVISRLAKLYATDKEAYNTARALMHSVTGDAYVA